MSEFNSAWPARVYDFLNQAFVEWDPQNAEHYRQTARLYRKKGYEELTDYEGFELLGWLPI